MQKAFVLLLFIILQGQLFGQKLFTLQGKVEDNHGHFLAGATIYIDAVKQGAVSDEEGSYTILNIPNGKYLIQASYVGFEPYSDSVTIDGNTTFNLLLEDNCVGLHEVTISEEHSAMEKLQRESSLNIEVVNDEFLKQNMGGSIMKSLERLPGVTTIDIGSGQSKPVIRGLGFNRVVVVENNVKHEAQQWGADHGLEIDQYAVENVEVIKGPASLQYGSDAIGGVIDMNNKSTPKENTWGGTIDLSGKTNNDFIGTSISLYGRKKWFFANARATILDYGDYKVPADSVDIYSYRAPLFENHLRNTAGGEQDLHLTLGLIKKNFFSKLFLSNVRSKNGFFANTHGLEPRNIDTDMHDASNRDILFPYQNVNHFKAISTSQYYWEKSSLEIDLGYQSNVREEWSQYVSHGYMPSIFPDTLSFNPSLERQFNKQVLNSNLRFKHELNDNTDLSIGINAENQNNSIDGRGFIIPAYNQFTVGAYAFAKHYLSSKSILQLGVRYDVGKTKTEQYKDWFSSPVINNTDTTPVYLVRAGSINRSFNNLSWSVGYNYNLEKWSLKANVGKSFRMPIPKELAANGVNYHRFSYEVGNPNLDPEVAYQFDAGIDYHSKKFAVGISPFLNYFQNYIYLNPSPNHDRLYGNGNQIFNYTQSKVLRYGGEFHAHYELNKNWQIGAIAEYVYARQLSGDKKGFTLPFSPPFTNIINLKYHRKKIAVLENAYVSLDYKIGAAQNNIVPPEVVTPGYQVFNLRIGSDFALGSQKMSVSMQVQNLLNQKYFNHTSYYRLINIPEPGRNFIINISIPIKGNELVSKKNL